MKRVTHESCRKCFFSSSLLRYSNFFLRLFVSFRLSIFLLLSFFPSHFLSSSSSSVVLSFSPSFFFFFFSPATFSPSCLFLSIHSFYLLQGAVFATDATAVLGGRPPYQFGLSEGLLPLGLTFDNNTGIVSGKPAESGEFANIIITAFDANEAREDFNALTIKVHPALAVALPDGVNQSSINPLDAIAWSVSASGGDEASHSFKVVGTLPHGLAFDAQTRRVVGTVSASAAGEALRKNCWRMLLV